MPWCRVNAGLPLLALLPGLDQTERSKRVLLLGAIAGNAVLLASYGVGWHWPELSVQSLLRVGLLVGVLRLYLTRCRRQVAILAAVARDSDRTER